MSELSNALRFRLASREKPEVHPDADTLTAYVEQLLPVSERNEVLEHLTLCNQCRDVIALSQPEQPELAPGRPAVIAPPVGRGWRAWILGKPALGLAASLAGLAIVTTLIIELPRSSVQKSSGGQPASFTSAGNSAPAPSPEQPKAVENTPAAPPLVDADKARRDVETHTGAAGRAPSTAPVVPTETARAKSIPGTPESPAAGPYVNTLMFANDAGNAVPPPVNEVPSAPAPHVADQKGFFSNNSQLSYADVPHQTQSSSKPLRMFTPPAGSSNHFGLSIVTKVGSTLGNDAKQLFGRPSGAPINAFALRGRAMGGAGQFNPAKEGKELEPAPEVAAGSAAPGKDVADLEQSRAFTTRALAGANANVANGAVAEERYAEAASAWRVGDSKLLKRGDSGAWAEAYPASEGIDFSVVSSHGSEIWAGGANAALVHSRDSGATWERVTLGASAAGTITSIQASGLKLLVKSSSGQSWSSPDGGRTWVLQD